MEGCGGFGHGTGAGIVTAHAGNVWRIKGTSSAPPVSSIFLLAAIIGARRLSSVGGSTQEKTVWGVGKGCRKASEQLGTWPRPSS